uniref:Uncharacterized protein n=1 Tax=Brassica oleracea var. oleracea TaxID=109376 RepID=A0A0D2ZZ67_BRAOL
MVVAKTLTQSSCNSQSMGSRHYYNYHCFSMLYLLKYVLLICFSTMFFFLECL